MSTTIAQASLAEAKLFWNLGEGTLDIIIIIAGFISNLLFFFLVLAINKKVVYVIFIIFLIVGIILCSILLLINNTAIYPIPNSIFIAGMIPNATYLFFTYRAMSRLNAESTATKV